MRVLYEGTIFNRGIGQPFGGISRYFQRLLTRLPADFDATITLRGDTPVLFEGNPPPTIHQLRLNHWRPWKLFSRVEALVCKHHPQFIPAHLDHPTYYTGLDGQAVSRGRRPMVITVYDMIHELYPDEFAESKVFIPAKRKAIESADLVLCISETTRRDLLERIPIPAERVRVTPLAADPPTQTFADQPKTSRHQKFLYVGQRKAPYKNFGRLLKAFCSLAQSHKGARLTVAGPPWSNEENALIGLTGCADRIELVANPDDSTLYGLYRGSMALVYPSLYEGFGLPPLEAMQAGVPVICSSGGSIPEVVGDAALQFDPNSEEELRSRMEELLINPGLAGELIRSGHTQCARYSWDRTAALTWGAYRKLVSI